MKSKYKDSATFRSKLKDYKARLDLTIADLCVILEITDHTAWAWLHERAPHILTQEGVLARLEQEIKDRHSQRERISMEQLKAAIRTLKS